jgi:hypothetical protein
MALRLIRSSLCAAFRHPCGFGCSAMPHHASHSCGLASSCFTKFRCPFVTPVDLLAWAILTKPSWLACLQPRSSGDWVLNIYRKVKPVQDLIPLFSMLHNFNMITDDKHPWQPDAAIRRVWLSDCNIDQRKIIWDSTVRDSELVQETGSWWRQPLRECMHNDARMVSSVSPISFSEAASLTPGVNESHRPAGEMAWKKLLTFVCFRIIDDDWLSILLLVCFRSTVPSRRFN